MAIVSLIVAVIAVGVAAASAWYSHSQVAEMRRQFEQSGPLIEVTSSTGIPIGLGTNRLQTGVTVTNKGRGDANIRNWGFTMTCPGEKQGCLILGTMYPLSFGPTIPHVVSGLDEATWFMDRDGLREAIAQKGGSNVRPFVNLGDGTQVLGPEIKFK